MLKMVLGCRSDSTAYSQMVNCGYVMPMDNWSVIGRHMRKRLFFGDNEEDYGFMTTKKHDPAVLNNEALLYVDNEVMGETIFRKYMVPEIEWVEDIAKRYKEYEKNHKNEEA
jgi:hypothetical protein